MDFEKGKRKTPEYLHHRGEVFVFVIGFCSMFVSLMCHSLTVMSVHPSQQYTAVCFLLTMINGLNLISLGDTMPGKYHKRCPCTLDTERMKTWRRSPQEEKCFEKSDEMEIRIRKDNDADYAETAFEQNQLHGRVHKFAYSKRHRGVQWAMTVCFPVI